MTTGTATATMNETIVDQVSENPADELLAGVDLGEMTNEQNEESAAEPVAEREVSAGGVIGAY